MLAENCCREEAGKPSFCSGSFPAAIWQDHGGAAGADARQLGRENPANRGAVFRPVEWLAVAAIVMKKKMRKQCYIYMYSLV